MEEKKGKQVPNLALGEKQQVRDQTKDVPLMINGKETNITMKKLSTGVRNKIRSECAITRVIGGQHSVKINEEEIQEKILSACIIQAPFDYTLNGIKALPAEVSDYLFYEYTNFAETTETKKD